MRIAPLINTSGIYTQNSFRSANVAVKRIPTVFFDKEGGYSKEFVGSVAIKEKFSGGSVVNADIYKEIFQKDKKENSEKYFMTVNGKKVGEMILTIEEDDIFIAHLESLSRNRYRGIGSSFIQLAIEKSLKSPSKPPVKLNARKLHVFQRNPVPFYQKMGFVVQENISEQDKNFFGTPMYLHPMCESRWLERIKKKPILKQNPYAHTMDTCSFGSKSKDVSNISKNFNNKIDIVFSDIDGTIRSRANGISEATRASIKQLHETGVPVILSSGRPFGDLAPVSKELGVSPDYAITQQGTTIVDKNGNIIFEDLLDEKSANLIIELAKKYREIDPTVHLLMSFEGKVYSEIDPKLLPVVTSIAISKTDDSFSDLVKQGKRFSKAIFYKTDSVDFSGLNHVEDFLKASLPSDLCAFKSGKRFCEITNSTASKGNAALIIAKKMGIDLKNAAGIGDADNDFILIKTIKDNGGLGIAMGNSTDNLKNEADYITSDILDDGFAIAMREILKNNERLASAGS